MEKDHPSSDISPVVYTLLEAVKSESTSSSVTNQLSAPDSSNQFPSIDSHCPKSNATVQTEISANQHLQLLHINNETHFTKKVLEMLLQINWNNYIRWRLLLSFGFVLWLTLCITDKFIVSRSITVQRVDPVESTPEKIIYTKLPCEIEDHESWFYKMWSCIAWSIALSRINEAYIFILFIGMMFCTETNWRKHHEQQESFTQRNEYAKTQTIDKYRDDFIEMMNNSSENMYDELGLLQSNQRAVTMIPFNGFDLKSNRYWQWKLRDEKSAVDNDYKRNGNRHINKLGIQSQLEDDRYYWNNAFKFNTPSRHMCNYSSTKINEFIQSNDDLYDIHQHFLVEKSSSVNNLFTNDSMNNRMISSSPAFKQFLLKLQNNPTSFNKFTKI